MEVGTQLGPYRIESVLGAGGMGQVWRGVDTRLDRPVAIKVSADQFSDRFEREARAISALNHPHICTLYDVGPNYLVMELVEGETLSARLKKRALPMELVLRYGAEIADALAAAHARGIIHRDLKPGNIMLAKSGVKVLDFGLAKMSQAEATETLTLSNVVMGTPAYMAPEQREGKPCDARSDIYSLGLVLRAMAGKEIPPGQFAHVVDRCLAEDPAERWQSASDVKRELEWAGKSQPAAATTVRRWPWIAATAVLAIAAAFLIRRPSSSELPVRLSLSFEGLTGEGNPPAPSPDGRDFVFMAFDASGRRSLWIRPINSQSARQLPGTEDALQPIWSADSRWIGFYQQGKMKKVSVGGGAPQTVAEMPRISGGTASGAAWNDKGDIIFPENNRGSLFRVKEGGTPEQLTKLDSSRQENSHRFPVFLPDGVHFLFVARSGKRENNALYVGSLDSAQPPRRLMPVQSNVAYVTLPAGGPELIYFRDASLFAQRFDGEKLLGDPAPVVENVDYSPASLYAPFAVSSDARVVIFRPGTSGPVQFRWLDRYGNNAGTLGPPGDYFEPRISPDGSLVAFSRSDAETGNRDVWYFETSRGVAQRLTTNPANDWHPVWAPDGRRLLFGSDRAGGPLNVTYLKASLEPGAAESTYFAAQRIEMTPFDWSKDGRWVVFSAAGGLRVSPAPGSEANFYSQTQFAETEARFSPDTKRIAYVSNESGRWEVYVRPFSGGPAGPNGKIQVSTNGGDYPAWRRDGKELFFIGADLKLYSVTDLQHPAPAPLFTPCSDTVLAGLPMRGTAWEHPYDITPDGQRFLFRCNTLGPGRFDVMLNWAMPSR